MPELTWEGKSRPKTAPERHPSLRTLELDERIGGEAGIANRLVWGDNRHVLASLEAELAGRVTLVYIDPPFETGGLFSRTRRVGADAGSLVQTVYRDRRGLDRYLGWLAEILARLRPLLTPDGSLYVHLDWHAGPYAKVLLDEIMGPENFLGEIVWNYGSPSGGRAGAAKLVKSHDILYAYAAERGRHKYRREYLPYSPKYIADWFKWTDPDGRRYRKRMRGKNPDGTPKWEIQYLDQSPGVPASSVWSDIQQVYADPRAYKSNTESELWDFPTQKPERLLSRIVRMATDEKDLVLDCFAGSGTTAAVAERLGRRWIACDVGAVAVQTTRKRLLALSSCEPFAIQVLSDETHLQWASERFGLASREQGYRALVLDRFGAQPVSDQGALHGRVGERPVHVGPLGSTVARETLAAAQAIAKSQELDLLGWDFTPEVQELAARDGVQLYRIPPALLDEEGVVSPEDFTPLGRPSLAWMASDRRVTVALTGYVPGREADTTHVWHEWIDSFAIDWESDPALFRPRFHAFRRRKRTALVLEASHVYPRAGTYRVRVQVIDLFGAEMQRELIVTV